MNRTRAFVDERTLVLTRTFRAPIDDVWSSVTESDRLSRWYGTWTGDPASGHVMVTLTAEAEPIPPARYEIRVCRPPHLLTVSTTDDEGTWTMTISLAETAGTTTLELRHEDIDPQLVGSAGPGWEWYLDRLVAAFDGNPPPNLAAFETTYLPLTDQFVALTGASATHDS